MALLHQASPPQPVCSEADFAQDTFIRTDTNCLRLRNETLGSGSGLLLEPHSDDSTFRPLAARAERKETGESLPSERRQKQGDFDLIILSVSLHSKLKGREYS